MKKAILSSDPQAVEKIKSKIAELEKLQAVMRDVNSAMRAARKAGKEAQIKAMAEAFTRHGRTQEQAEKYASELLTPDFAGRVGFTQYELTNNNANIRRLYERLEQVGEAQATPATEEEGTKARLEDCPPDNRVRLFFPGKPDEATRSRLKAAAFRWTPSLGCWQAYRNYHSLRTARIEAGLPEQETVTAPEVKEAFTSELQHESGASAEEIAA